MPFTFCHPAIILPFGYVNKRWISLTGLVAGSIVPDFEYFIRMRDISVISHTWPGIFWFDLPAALLLTFIYYGIVHRPLITNLPSPLRKRLYRYRNFSWTQSFKARWFIVILSIIAGAASHILWDKFTHGANNAIVNMLIAEKHIETSLGEVIAYYLFWAVNSIVGGLAIVYALYQLPVSTETERGRGAISFWIVLGSLAVLGCLAFLIFRLILLKKPELLEQNYVVLTIAASFLALVLTSLFYKYKTQ